MGTKATHALDPTRVTKVQIPVNPLFSHAPWHLLVVDAAGILTAAATNAEDLAAEKLADLPEEIRAKETEFHFLFFQILRFESGGSKKIFEWKPLFCVLLAFYLCDCFFLVS